MSFREKLLDLKRRLSDRKMYSIVIVIIGAVAVWGIYQYKEAAQLRQRLDNQYNRAFFDMVGYVNNVEVLLMKSMLTSTPTKTAATLQEAWRQANLAQENLGQLPVAQPVLANTAKFLTQVGDFSYSLNNQNMAGNNLNDQQYKTIEQLHGFSVSLGNSLVELQNSITTGRIRWGALERKGKPIFQKASAQTQMQQIEDIDKTFQAYPTLIYDGPFSDHMVTAEPKGLTGEMLNSEQAKKSVIDFFGADKVNAVNDLGKNDSEPIKTYSYEVTFKGAPEGEKAVIDVTQKGGHIFWMLHNRAVPSDGLDIVKAKEMGKQFLESRGFKNMVDTYFLKEDNTATINYAYKQGNVTVYPDLIKVKIALDNGSVVGFEAKSYIAAHEVRNIPQPKLTMEQARAKVTNRMQILSSGIAIIPTDYKAEILTYEFKGKMNDRDFLVYINADNGNEENILMIIDTPEGVLTM